MAGYSGTDCACESGCQRLNCAASSTQLQSADDQLPPTAMLPPSDSIHMERPMELSCFETESQVVMNNNTASTMNMNLERNASVFSSMSDNSGTPRNSFNGWGLPGLSFLDWAKLHAEDLVLDPDYNA